MVKEFEAYAGENVSHAAERMVAVIQSGEAKRLKCRFNDVLLLVDGDSTVDSIVADFHQQFEAKAEAYRNSPKGKAAAAKSEAERVALQQTADRLMGELPHLNFNDPKAVLSWLCDMEEPRDRVGVKVDYERMLHTFCQHGWQPDVYCGSEFNENDKWIFAAWIAGQALCAIYVPMTRHFTARWKERFA